MSTNKYLHIHNNNIHNNSINNNNNPPSLDFPNGHLDYAVNLKNEGKELLVSYINAVEEYNKLGIEYQRLYESYRNRFRKIVNHNKTSNNLEESIIDTEIAKLEDELQKEKKNNQTLLEENYGLQTVIEKYKKDETEQKNEIITLTTQLTENKKRINDLTNDNSKTEQKYKSLQSDYNKKNDIENNTFNTQNKAIIDLSLELKNKNIYIEKLENDNKKLKAENNCSDKIKELQQENNQLKIDIEKYKKGETEQLNKITTLTTQLTENINLSFKLENNNIRLQEEQKKILKIETDNKILEDKNKKLEDYASKTALENIRLNRTNAKLNKMCKKMDTKKNDNDNDDTANPKLIQLIHDTENFKNLHNINYPKYNGGKRKTKRKIKGKRVKKTRHYRRF